MSKKSARNCKVNRSVSFVFFRMEKSVLKKRGPVNALRARSPKWHVVGSRTKLVADVAFCTLLNVHGTANPAFGVVAQSGRTG
jgi:hypothetical protein